MAMCGDAGYWYEGLSDFARSNYEELLKQFEYHYGGTKSSMNDAIATLKILKQSKEPMVTFGPRIKKFN